MDIEYSEVTTSYTGTRLRKEEIVYLQLLVLGHIYMGQKVLH